jgi:hypothetical protein
MKTKRHLSASGTTANHILVVKERKYYVRKETCSFFRAEGSRGITYIRKHVVCQENKYVNCHAELRKFSGFG